MPKHIVISEDRLPNFKQIVKEFGIKTKGKKVYFIPIDFIEPNKFHPKVWSRNWLFALDVLNNGSVFDEIYVLIIKSTKDVDHLYKEQVDVIRRKCIFIS